MKRIAIIDDESNARQLLVSILKNHCPEVELVGEANSVASGIHLIRQTKPDAVLLDISMGDGTCFDLLDQISNLDFKVIFTTAFDDFAIRAFRYNALDYLLKPLIPKDLVAAINRIENVSSEIYTQQIKNLLEDARQKKHSKIVLSSQEEFIFIQIDQIVHLHSEGNYTTFYLFNKKRIVVSRPIGEFEELLPENSFFRIHQSYIVNIAFVKKIMKEEGGGVVMEDDSQLPISRRRKSDFLDYARRYVEN